jgi:hypothetical protein
MYGTLAEILAHATLEHGASLFIIIQLGFAGTTATVHGVVVFCRHPVIRKVAAKAVAPVKPIVAKVVSPVVKVVRKPGPIPEKDVA